MGFSRQEYWSGLPFSPPGIESRSPAWHMDSLLSESPGKHRILEWVDYPFSRGSSQPRNQIGVSFIAAGFFLPAELPGKPVKQLYPIQKKKFKVWEKNKYKVMGGTSLHVQWLGLLASSGSIPGKELRSHKPPYPAPAKKKVKGAIECQGSTCTHQNTQGQGLAAKSLQSCPTLCDPMSGSPPGSPIPGILQARTLEWVAISFSNA